MTMPTRTPNKASTSSTADAINSAAAVERMINQAQLARLSSRLQDIPNGSNIARAFGGSPDQYAATLAKQYTDLAANLRGTDLAKAPVDRVSARLNQMANLFGWWQSVQAPIATEQLVSTPSGVDTRYAGVMADISAGNIAPFGEVFNPTSSNPTDEAWWVNTWQYLIPLPTTSSTVSPGTKTAYRFNVGAGIGLYGGPAVGSVQAYATVATTPDLAGHPIDYSQPVSSQFAIVDDLPDSAITDIAIGTAKFTGSITLSPGKTPAIGILIGLIFGVGGGGQVSIVPGVATKPGDVSSIALSPPDATTASDFGKIEIRSDPLFWIEAVTKMSAAI
jgi:hypothetical protein